MLGIKLFSPKQILVVKEKVHKKNKYYLYITRHLENGVIEYWAVASKNPYKVFHKPTYFLGIVTATNWIKESNYYDLDRSMIRMSEWVYRNKVQKYIDEEEVGVYTLGDMKKKLKKKDVYTREDFVKFGKLGQEKVRERNKGKGSVELRWAKKKLSPEKVA